MSDYFTEYDPLTDSKIQFRSPSATKGEIDLFCEEEGVVRPDPNDERAVCSFASWFTRWRHERRNGAGSW